jgi:hypothetical protein
MTALLILANLCMYAAAFSIGSDLGAKRQNKVIADFLEGLSPNGGSYTVTVDIKTRLKNEKVGKDGKL